MPRSKFSMTLEEKAFMEGEGYDQLQFGFELETQELLGCSWNNSGRIVDRNRDQAHTINQAELGEISRYIAHERLVDKMEDCSFLRFAVFEARQKWPNGGPLPAAVIESLCLPTAFAWCGDADLGLAIANSGLTLGKLLGHLRSIGSENYAEQIEDQVLDLLALQVSLSECRSRMNTTIQSLQDRGSFYADIAKDNWHPLLTCVGDGSVNGPEVKPTRPASFAECKEACDLLFKNEMVVDTQCSFHVHVSVKGESKSSYDRKLQLFMLEFLVGNISNIPESCKERWKNKSQMARYCTIHPSEGKYSFIHFHPRFKTWEFRCFGNISNAKDAVRCIELAARAYRYALRRMAARARPLVTGATSNKMFFLLKKTLYACLSENETSSFSSPKEIFQKESKAMASEYGSRKFQLSHLRDSNNNDYQQENNRTESQDYSVACENVVRILSVS